MLFVLYTQYLNYRPNNEGCKGKLEIGVMAVADAEIQKRLMVKNTHKQNHPDNEELQVTMTLSQEAKQ